MYETAYLFTFRQWLLLDDIFATPRWYFYNFWVIFLIELELAGDDLNSCGFLCQADLRHNGVWSLDSGETSAMISDHIIIVFSKQIVFVFVFVFACICICICVCQADLRHNGVWSLDSGQPWSLSCQGDFQTNCIWTKENIITNINNYEHFQLYLDKGEYDKH